MNIFKVRKFILSNLFLFNLINFSYQVQSSVLHKKFTEIDNLITEEGFQYILIEIIGDVIEKRKEIHQRYQRLIKKVLCCQKPLNRRTLISKYLMSRVIRESDRVFNNAQNLAKNLCPSCKNKFENYNSFSDKLH